MAGKNKVPLFDDAVATANFWFAVWQSQSAAAPNDMAKLPAAQWLASYLLGESVAVLTGAAVLTKRAHYIAVDTTAGAFSLTLPAVPDAGQEILFKDEVGMCGTNALGIVGTVDGTVDPAGVIQINYGWYRVRWNATTTKWSQI